MDVSKIVKDATMFFQVFDNVMKEIREKYAVQVMTNIVFNYVEVRRNLNIHIYILINFVQVFVII